MQSVLQSLAVSPVDVIGVAEVREVAGIVDVLSLDPTAVVQDVPG